MTVIATNLLQLKAIKAQIIQFNKTSQAKLIFYSIKTNQLIMSYTRITISDIPSLEQLQGSPSSSKSPENFSETWSFITSNTPLLEFQDRDLISSTRWTLIHYGLFSVLAPTVINLTVPLSLPFLSRFLTPLVKTLIYLPPIFLYFQYYKETNSRLMLYECLKYSDRISRYNQSQDRFILNPNYEKDDIY